MVSVGVLAELLQHDAATRANWADALRNHASQGNKRFKPAEAKERCGISVVRKRNLTILTEAEYAANIDKPKVRNTRPLPCKMVPSFQTGQKEKAYVISWDHQVLAN